MTRPLSAAMRRYSLGIPCEWRSRGRSIPAFLTSLTTLAIRSLGIEASALLNVGNYIQLPTYCKRPPPKHRAQRNILRNDRITGSYFSHCCCSSPHAAVIWARLVSTTLCADAADYLYSVPTNDRTLSGLPRARTGDLPGISSKAVLIGPFVIRQEPSEICDWLRRLNYGFGAFRISFLRIDDLPASDCVAHLRKCCSVPRGISAQDHEVGFHSFRDATSAVGVSELPRWIGAERCEDLLEIHSRPRHESEFQRGIEMVRSEERRVGKEWK